MENATMQVAAEPEGKRPLGKKTKPQMGQPYRHPGRRDAEAAGKDTTVLETPGARADRQARGVPTPNRLFAGSPSFTPGRAQAAEAVGQRGLEEQLGSLSLGTREQRNNRERRQGEGKAGARPQRKPKNTECFEPDASTDMRLVFGRHSQKSLKQDRGDYHVKDVCMVPDLLCAEDDMETYHALLAELSAACPEGGPEAGLSLAKGRDGLWATWHGDTHVIADDKKMGGKWKRLSPTFGRVVERMAEYFDMDVKATRLNWYRPGSEDWKPYHHDRAAFTPNCPQNITVAASFGATRDVGFQHARTRTVMSLPQPNGSCYAFGRDVNCEWKHGVLPLRAGEARPLGRVSIIAWGMVDMAEGGC